MKEFRNLSLCSYVSERVRIYVTADLVDGALRLSCQDLGTAVEDFFGDSDYEYWYSFNQENTVKLFQELNALDDPAKALLERFSGESGTRNLTAFCIKHNIRYSFFSYA